MTTEQDKLISEALAAAETCRKRAAQAAHQGLLILAREYDYFATSIVERVEWQRHALDQQSVAEVEGKTT